MAQATCFPRIESARTTIWAEGAMLCRQAAWLAASFVLAASAVAANPAQKTESAPATPAPTRSAEEPADSAETTAAEQALYDEFSKTLTGAKLTGFFTIAGKEQQLKEETYHIQSVKKLEGDLWLMQCQIKYGDKDVTVPLPIPVKWADKTPVMTIDQLTIPALGTFDARVLIHGDKYVGTWGHGEIKGHLFGRIERDEPASE